MTSESFTELYTKYWSRCYRYARTFLSRAGITHLQGEDLAQQVFYEIWRKGEFEAKEPLKKLLYMVRYRGIDIFRKKGIYDPVESLPVKIPQFPTLPPQQSKIIRLYLEGYNTKEAASIMGCSQSTARWHKMEAIKAIKKSMNN